MNYIFVFLGEFGYELLNWQGVIRKFVTTINKDKDKVIICSRTGLEPFYEFADEYIDISKLMYFKNSAANMYWAHNPDCNIYKRNKETLENGLDWELMSKKDLKYQNKMKKEIKQFILKQFKVNLFQRPFIFKNYKFIFSSDYQKINGLFFGTKSMSEPKIYADLDLNNNNFVKIEPCKKNKKNIEVKLGFSLADEYILCQTGSRNVVQRSKEHVEYKILNTLSKKAKIVLLNFDTKRKLDSKSLFPEIENCCIYNCNSFEEQSVLIANAFACVFFTEGDFRSHNYLPPFMGKNVYSIAPKTVFELGTTPIDFWNKNVFKFGGQIIPVVHEEIDKFTDLLVKGKIDV